MNNYYVQIIEFDTNKVEKEYGPMTENRAERMDDGININLNHDKYFTNIVQKNEDVAQPTDLNMYDLEGRN